MSKKFSYSEALEEIQFLVDTIENEELDIDELAVKVKRVCLLIKQCKEKLHETETEIDQALKELNEKD